VEKKATQNEKKFLIRVCKKWRVIPHSLVVFEILLPPGGTKYAEPRSEINGYREKA
jgi:hypothetical protein